VKKLRLLVIAPYKGLEGLVRTAINERDNLEADVFTASLDDSIKLISEIDILSYDAVISRGTTGEMLKNNVDIPYIDLETTVSDIIRAVQLAQNGLTKFAFVGYPKMCTQVNLYCEFMQIDAEINPVYTVEDAEQTIRELQKNGCKFIIGDGIAVDIAKSLGMSHILITSGIESVNLALDNAQAYYKHTEGRAWTKYMLLDEAMGISEQSVIIFDDANNIIFTKNLGRDTQKLTIKLKAQIPLIQKQGMRSFIEAAENQKYHITGKAYDISDRSYVIFICKKLFVKSATGKEIYKVQTFSESELNENLSLYSSSEVMSEIFNKVKSCINYSLPILVIGEPGCGKDTLAYTIFAMGNYKNGMLITIDCSTITTQDWKFLISDEDSPLYDNNNCIYFKEVPSLSVSAQNDLYSLINNTSLFTRNQVIFSMRKQNGHLDEKKIIYPLYNLINGISFNIPALRERINELPSIAACYINVMNQRYPTQVIGFDEDAINLLKSFDWPNNIDQLRQAIKELVILADKSYITSNDIKFVLNKNQSEAAPDSPDSISSIDFSKTLYEIERDIIKISLQRNNMNQSITAKQLGISRGTLWRKLKE
jgi:DNA-binding NtrC family response regulator